MYSAPPPLQHPQPQPQPWIMGCRQSGNAESNSSATTSFQSFLFNVTAFIFSPPYFILRRCLNMFCLKMCSKMNFSQGELLNVAYMSTFLCNYRIIYSSISLRFLQTFWFQRGLSLSNFYYLMLFKRFLPNTRGLLQYLLRMHEKTPYYLHQK